MARRYSAPAEASAEFFAGVGAVDDEARAGERLEHGGKRRIADPVVRPGQPPAQRQRRAGVERDEAVEARAQFAAGVGRGARIISEREAAAVGVGLAVARRAEALRLDRGIRSDPAVEGREAVAAFDAAAERLRVEAGGEVVAGKGEAVGRHPMVGVCERCREIGRAPARRAVEAGLERVALPSAEPLGEAPVGAAAGEREADHAVMREMIVEPAGEPRRGGGQIMAAEQRQIA